jgi:hypothetical protein
MTFDGKAFGEQLVEQVRGYVDRTLGPISARLDEIEQRMKALPTPRDGVDADPAATADIVILRLKPEIEAVKEQAASIPVLVETAVKAIPLPKDGRDGMDGSDGKSVTVDDVAPIIASEVAKAVSALPVPKDGENGADGKSVTLDEIAPLVEQAVAAKMADIPLPKDGQDGKSVTVEELAPLVEDVVAKSVSALPAPKDGEPGKSVTVDEVMPGLLAEAKRLIDGLPKPQDGKSITVEDVAPMIEETVQKHVSAIPVPKDGRDGVDVTDLIISREGSLVAVLSNGSSKSLGPVIGRDGKDGEPGRDGRDGIDAKAIDPSELPDAPILDDGLNDRIAKAVRLMAEMPVNTGAVEDVREKEAAAPVHVHMPEMKLPAIELVVPKMEPTPVTVTLQQPPKRKTRTVVEEHDARGRVKKFRQEEIE